MAGKGNYHIDWDDFTTTSSERFRALVGKKEFSDVTLVGGDFEVEALLEDSEKFHISGIYYLMHLVFNTIWSVVFFVFHNMVLALMVLILLIGLIINLILRFKRVNLISSYLMIPYLLWCSFALFLNINLIMIN